ncbi:hydroxymethylpyrimidine/phosphomethylpyrimidine kinase [Verminephrobacter aporrectodeae subsp. tuberculatae]|uniref:Hydroxymethylpyrimidine/phosphomethylpyrimidine kinase n=1 Tax=Verminephrobacter aporrectodeae subsp. tuberculatae TaxID=1110392 RepID=A0ABT3KS80_9BURK|nr:bifunctional hydroxymethylpyrimidine kinase/phosphomethylpyrimidine kinase [Verminephrobacter aporrectodeae]MCW5219889.1 hydroxymethylpyrimidine/phosphomethylpyrimidine kinase [Verminephrobacter aporrectodeae subsp. tuberculatae]MCW5256114.1 hydroxymethylpyrimidine/phosphomethylpyrimidine kinase [Verminephrobacter aporrectodeae subsp. tuberculatae]MCW5289177.1 hydroxymethylpyrimidine/phosphomethylpyrimidine kinase [Verminephrobacter aporrectodeae subsp. tuberculatae]MCW5321163.1 hydroxymethy
MATQAPSPPSGIIVPEDGAAQETSPACVLTFNASDPSGAGGLTADITAIASVGGHPMAVVTGAYERDTTGIFDHFSFDDEAVTDQAQAVLEDLPVQAIKIGFVGSPENISAIARITTDYDEVPVIAYMPNLSWWHDELIDAYMDAFENLLLPQTSVLVGNHSTLWRWLLPDWTGSSSPCARDIARAASALGVPYTLVTGIPLPEQFVENVLASPHEVLGSGKYELFDATFCGAGDTLSAALTALVASGNGLGEATGEALSYLDRCLSAGFRPGMGHIVPDRMFWAQSDDGDEEEAATIDEAQTIEGFVMPPHDTKH